MLTISKSFGHSWFAGTQVGNNMKTRRRHNRNTQNIAACITHPKEAHLIEQMDQPRPGAANHEQGAHKECTGQRWAQTASVGVWPNPWMGRPPSEAVQAHLWREDPPYPLEGSYQRSRPYLTQELTYSDYKRDLPHPSQVIPIPFSYTSRRRSSSSVPLVSLE